MAVQWTSNLKTMNAPITATRRQATLFLRSPSSSPNPIQLSILRATLISFDNDLLHPKTAHQYLISLGSKVEDIVTDRSSERLLQYWKRITSVLAYSDLRGGCSNLKILQHLEPGLGHRLIFHLEVTCACSFGTWQILTAPALQ